METRPIVAAIDCETTGLGPFGDGSPGREPREDTILSVGIALRLPPLPGELKGEIFTWESTIRPDPSFLADGRADFALQLNGLTREELSAAPPAWAVAAQLNGLLAAIDMMRLDPTHQCSLVAYRADFDRHFVRMGLSSAVADRRWQCAMARAAQIEPEVIQVAAAAGHKNGHVPLRVAAAHYNVTAPEKGQHSAAVDAKWTLELWEQLDAIERERARVAGDLAAFRELGGRVMEVPAHLLDTTPGNLTVDAHLRALAGADLTALTSAAVGEAFLAEVKGRKG